MGAGRGREGAAGPAEARSSSTAATASTAAATAEAVIAGDAFVMSIAAASIVAKVTRDRLMKRLGAVPSGLRLRAPHGLQRARAPARR